MNTTCPTPSDIKLHTQSRLLELIYSDGERYELSCEYLRVYSPSAEVKGHGPEQEVLQIGKINVSINAIEPVGNYALQLVFSDGHNSGIYSWDYLYQLATHKAAWWQDYLQRLNNAGASRDPNIQVVKIGK
ncbi:DUF971 domain-containing protein [uncultured Oceanicoccus sp.]|uniref:DUF971 domain-containing protein n=1 Tax=uncultured Oceanicoccus sp. TaxID=1706381 RepID=UPI0030DA0F69